MRQQLRNRQFILVAEDDPADRDLIRRALDNGSVTLQLVNDGEQVLEYIRKLDSAEAGCIEPDLIIADLNMPRLDGKSMLTRLKAEHGGRRIPVVVFSSSDNELDVADCYSAGCVSYVVKPTDLEPFMGALNMIVGYWLELVHSPRLSVR